MPSRGKAHCAIQETPDLENLVNAWIQLNGMSFAIKAITDSLSAESFMHRNVEIRYTPRKLRTGFPRLMSFSDASQSAMRPDPPAPSAVEGAGLPTGSKTLFFLFVATCSAVFVLFVCWQLGRWL